MSDGTKQTISDDKLAALTGLKDERHRTLAKEGYFPSPAKGQYQLAATLQGLFRYYREHEVEENSKPAKLGIVKNMKAAAGATGYPLAVIEESNNAGCKAIRQNGTIDCDSLKSWIEQHPEILERAGEKVNRESEEALSAQLSRKLRERKLAIIDREIITLDEAKINTVSVLVKLKTKLLTIPQRLAQKLALVNDPSKIENAIASEIKESLREASINEMLTINCPHCGKHVADA